MYINLISQKNMIKLFNNPLIVKLISKLGEKQLPKINAREKTILNDLKKFFINYPEKNTSHLLPSEKVWTENMNRLRELVIYNNPRKFLRWDIINKTMFISYGSYISKELNFLKQLPDWKSRWKRSIKESWVGKPIPYAFYLPSSANLIHHAYHVAQFEKKTKTKIDKLDFIFEFGGGYGSLSRLCYKLGFKGYYIIFDLPPFVQLQKYYLGTQGLPIIKTEKISTLHKGITCISNIDELEALLNEANNAQKKMFIATWSISETPIKFRNSLLPLISNFNNFLIAYQDEFREINNIEFFQNWKNSITHITWNKWEIDHLPKNNYLIGFEKNS